MTTPPSRLLEKLPTEGLIDIRSVLGLLEERVTHTQAVAEVIRGAVEGVGPRSGRVRYLRRLPASAMQPAAPERTGDEAYASHSTAVAQVHMGVYRQEVESARMDEYGLPTRIVIGHVFAFCALRGVGM